jgi:lysophospholipid acyltransferase (LPLAT)-like uncharacterized protein
MKDTVIGLLAGGLAWTVARTWHMEAVGDHHVEQLRRSRIPVVFAVWHARLLPPLWHRRGEGITLLVSRHADGGRLARAASRWGYGVVRGSATRGGVGGLLGVVRVLLRGGDVAFTPDGPRGPAGAAKPGAVAAARMGRAAIVPVGAAASAEWRLSSWDRFTVPRPFSRVRVVYGTPLDSPVSRETDPDALRRLEEALVLVQRAAECR